jgi:hypothetical protein
MREDDHQALLLLKADADELCRSANLPTAHAILWKGKIRATRRRRQRVVTLMALAEILGASALVVVSIGLVWRSLLNAPVSAHALTVIVAGVLTIVAIGVIVTGPFIALRSRSQ